MSLATAVSLLINRSFLFSLGLGGMGGARRSPAHTEH
jgi:hypothetical protein